MEHAEFDAAYAQHPEGYSEGVDEGRRFGVTVRRSGDGRRNSLFARELAGTSTCPSGGRSEIQHDRDDLFRGHLAPLQPCSI